MVDTPARPAAAVAMTEARLEEIRARINPPHGVCSYAGGDCFAAELLAEVGLRRYGIKLATDICAASSRAHQKTLAELYQLRAQVRECEGALEERPRLIGTLTRGKLAINVLADILKRHGLGMGYTKALELIEEFDAALAPQPAPTEGAGG